MYKESKSLEGLKAHEILKQKAINNYYLNPNHCKHCGEIIKIKEYEAPSVAKSKKFCSHSCSTSFNNSYRPYHEYRTVKKYHCVKCNEECGYRKKYCETCKNNLYLDENVTIDEVIYKNHHKAASFSYIRDKAKTKLKKQRKQICECCGYDKHVECSHIKAISSFDGSTKLSVVNNIDNLLWLCPNHHWEFDFGDLNIEEIKKSEYYHKNSVHFK